MQLAAEEIAILEILIESKEARERIPIADRALVGRPEKYAFPIGLDEEGHPLPIPPQRGRKGDVGEP